MNPFKRHLKPGGKPVYVDGESVTFEDYRTLENELEAAKHDIAELWEKVPHVHPKHEQVNIRFAFECGGEKYYTCNLEDMPPKRWQEYLLRHEENRMGASREYLLEMNGEMLKELSGKRGEVDHTRLIGHMHELQARLKLAPIKDHLYRLVSVCFFTKDEDLTTYDFAANNAKIDHWKKYNEPADFFFTKPVKKLVNFNEQSHEDLSDFFKNQEIMMRLRSILVRSSKPA